tara:strand:+ start:872 stop:1135 length:264 start_codon:yes stop_codon:yes gene_type:complete
MRDGNKILLPEGFLVTAEAFRWRAALLRDEWKASASPKNEIALRESERMESLAEDALAMMVEARKWVPLYCVATQDAFDKEMEKTDD